MKDLGRGSRDKMSEEFEKIIRKVLKERDDNKKERQNVIIYNIVMFVGSIAIGFLICSALMKILVSFL